MSFSVVGASSQTERSRQRRRGSVILDEADGTPLHLQLAHTGTVAFKGLPPDDTRKWGSATQPVNYHPSQQPTSLNDAEQRIRDLEHRYQGRIDHLNRLYEERLGSILQELEVVARSLRTDETIQVLRDDDASAVHVQARVKEVIDTSLVIEREKHVQRLMQDVATMESEQVAQKSTIARLQDELQLCNDDKAQFEAVQMGSGRFAEHVRKTISGALSDMPKRSSDGLQTSLSEEFQRLLDSLVDIMAHTHDDVNADARVQKEIVKLNDRMCQAQDSLVRSEMENVSLREALSKTEASLAQCDSDRLDLRQKYASVTEKVRALVAEEEKMHDVRVKELERALKEAESQASETISTLETNIAGKEEELRSMQTELMSREQTIQEHNSEVKRLEKQVSDNAEHMREVHTMFEAYRDQTDKEIAQLTEKSEREVKLLREHHIERKAELQGRIDSLESRSLECTQQHMKTVDHERIVADRLDELEKKYYDESKDIIDRVENDSKRQILETEEKMRDEYESKITIIKTELDKRVDETKARADQAINDAVTARANADQLSYDLKNTSEKLNAAESQCSELQAALSTAQHAAADAEAMYNELMELRDRVKAQAEDVSVVTRAHVAVEAERNELAERMEEMERSTKTLEAIVAEQRSQIAMLEAEPKPQRPLPPPPQPPIIAPSDMIVPAKRRALHAVTVSLGTRMAEIGDGLATLRRSIRQGMDTAFRQAQADIMSLSRTTRAFVDSQDRARHHWEAEAKHAYDDARAAERELEIARDDLERVKDSANADHIELEAATERRKTAQLTMDKELEEDYQRTIRALRRRIEEYDRQVAESTNARPPMSYSMPFIQPAPTALGGTMSPAELGGTPRPADPKESEWQRETEHLRKTVKKVKKASKETEEELQEARAALKKAGETSEAHTALLQQHEAVRVRVESLMTALGSRLPIPPDMIAGLTSTTTDLATHAVRVRECMDSINKFLGDIEGRADTETIHARQEAQRYSTTADESKARLSEAEFAVERLQREANDLKAKLEDAKDESKRLQAQLDQQSIQSSRDVEQTRSEARREAETARQLKREVADLQEQLRVTKRETENRIHTVQDEARRTLDQVRQESMTNTRTSDDQWREKLRETETKAANQQREREAELMAEQTALNERIRTIEAEHDSVMRRQQQQYSARIDDLQRAQNDDVVEGDRKVVLERQRIETEMNARLEAAEKNAKNLTNQLDDKSNEIKSKEREIAELKKKIADTEALRDKLTSALRDARNKLDQRDRVMKDLLSKKRKFLNAAAEKDKEISELHGLLEQAFVEVGDRDLTATTGKLGRESVALARRVAKNRLTRSELS